MKIKGLFKRILSASLAIAITITIWPQPIKVEAKSEYYTHSPLLSANTMGVDEMDPWELVCFGIFMSNFCIPFVDSYESAFSETAAEGSKGGGLAALKFSTGGDINSESIVRRMVTTVGTELANHRSHIYVDSYAITGLEEDLSPQFTPKSTIFADTSQDITIYRRATLADLLPLIWDVKASTAVDKIKQDNYDYVSTDPRLIWDLSWIGGFSSEVLTYNSDGTQSSHGGTQGSLADLTMCSGVLSKFFIANDDNSTPTDTNIVFDMTDAWDCQLPSQTLLYAAYKDAGYYLSKIDTYLKHANELELYFDAVGNITLVDGTIIIPACLNKHITINSTVNLLNAPLLNSIYDSTNTSAIASSVNGARGKNTDTWGTGKDGIIINAGINSLPKFNGVLPAGGSFLYNISSDTISKVQVYGNSVLSTAGSDLVSDNPLLTQAQYKSFINGDFALTTDKENTARLRWSTLCAAYDFSASNGVDLENFSRTDAGHSGAYYWKDTNGDGKYELYLESDSKIVNARDAKVNYNVHYALLTHSIKISDNENSNNIKVNAANDGIDYYQGLGVYQTVAQLIASTVKTAPNKVCYKYCTLKGGSNDERSILAGVDPTDHQSLIYEPIGTDRAAIALVANDSLAINSMFWAIALQAYHGKSVANAEADRKIGDAVASFDFNNKTYAAASINEIFTKKGLFNNDKKDAASMYKDFICAMTGTSDGWSKASTGLGTAIGETDRTVQRYFSQWVRIAPATPTLKTAASYLGLRTDCVFEEYASDMYYTYLITYGFAKSELANGSHYINTALLTQVGDNPISSWTPTEIGKQILGNGALTAEEREEAIKRNTYLMLAQDEEGREYRSRLVSGLVEDWLVDAYDKTCYGDTTSEYFKTLTSTSKSFIVLNNFAGNFMTKAIVENWSMLLPIIMLILSIFIVVLGTLNGKKATWILANLVITTCMLVLLPSTAEIAPYVVEKIADKAFKQSVYTMSVCEAVEDDKIRADIARTYGKYGKEIQEAVSSISALATSGSLMVKQDITRKTIPQNESNTFGELKGLASAKWLLPNLLSMTGADKESDLNNYVYRALGEKRNELRNMVIPEPDYTATSSTFDISAAATFNIYLQANSSLSSDIKFDQTYNSVASRGVSYSHITELILTNPGGDPIIEGSTVDSFDQIVSNVLSDLQVYQGYGDKSSKISNTINYLQGTESLYPYFYLVARDTLINRTGQPFNDISVEQFFYMLRPDNVVAAAGYNGTTRNISGDVVDVADLKYLFTYYMPYLKGMQDFAATEGEKLSNPRLLSSDYEVYAGEPKSFLFECNWADKILTQYNYGENNCELNPYYYTTLSRPYKEMVFSRAQFNQSGLSIKDLTDVELRCIEINERIESDWLLLTNYLSNKGVTIDILAEQMAIVATNDFNNGISKDRIVNENYALYPTALSIRTINFDTMMKLVLMSNYGLIDLNQQSMKIVLAESGLLSGIILWLTAWIVTNAIPFLMDFAMGVIFYATLLACIYNAAVDSKDKLKTSAGAGMSTLAIILGSALYIYSFSWIIGNPNKLLSVDQINAAVKAGSTAATGKIFLILIVSIVYSAFLGWYAIKMLKNFKDMSFEMWGSYSKKTFDAFQSGISKIQGFLKRDNSAAVGNATARAMNKAMGPAVKAAIDGVTDNVDLKVHNSDKKPLYTKETNTSDQSAYIVGLQSIENDSGYVTNDKSRTPVSKRGGSGSSGNTSSGHDKKSEPTVSLDDGSKNK